MKGGKDDQKRGDVVEGGEGVVGLEKGECVRFLVLFLVRCCEASARVGSPCATN